MKIFIQILLSVLVYVAVNKIFWVRSESRVVSVSEGEYPGGVWKTQREWKAYWVKEWVTKKVYVPVWKKVWGPVDVRKWVPISTVPNGSKRH